MIRKKVTCRLWYYGRKWVAEIIQRATGLTGYLHYCTSLEEVTGETPDILEYIHFAFYDWSWYNNNAGLGENKLAK